MPRFIQVLCECRLFFLGYKRVINDLQIHVDYESMVSILPSRCQTRQWNIHHL